MELLKTEFVPGDPPVLQVAGEIDICTVDQLRAALREFLSADPRAVVDMGGVTFFDACGLRALLEVAEARNGAGPLTLTHAHRVAWVLDLVGLRELPSLVIREDGELGGR